MADVKISGLPASTLPLAGTEVLPLVQSGVTKKVASDDLTVKNVRSNTTTGILQVAGPAAAATRVMTTPDANFTAARIDAAQSFTGDQTLSTGNLVIGTSGKGIDFTATPGAGTSELLADYEEGTWEPTATAQTGTITAYTSVGRYVKIGRLVNVFGEIEITTAGTAAGRLNFGSLPFGTDGGQYAGVARERAGTGVIYFTATDATASATGGRIQNSTNGAIDWTGGNTYAFTFSYQV
jgi:hypothetical protein